MNCRSCIRISRNLAQNREWNRAISSNSKSSVLLAPREQQSVLSKKYHSSSMKEISSTLIGVGVGLVVTGVVGKFVLDAVPSRHKTNITTEDQPNPTSGQSSTSQSSWMSDWFSRNFYDGGFEEKMTKREAALILGVREGASIERIKEAHRRVMLLNHPDKGGSAFLTAKINEAKDLLLKGKV